MKALFQDLRSGKTFVREVPAPSVQDGHLLVRNLYSVISTGTERMLGSFGKASLIGKARMQPERVAEVLRKAKKDGWKATYRAVQSKLSQPVPVGYAAAGIVEAVGAGVQDFVAGDLIATNAFHAEGAIVPKHLCAKVPAGVPAETAAFTIPGAIALQGIRLAAPQLGEAVIVLGLGLIGQLTAQLLKASGCIVIGADISARAIDLAKQWCDAVVRTGVDDLSAIAAGLTGNQGADAVLITTATDSNEPVHAATAACRKRGRIVLVGTAGLQLSRADFFRKELTFQVSCSYGPGRYDPVYEAGGQDYPIGFVRWTEQRNMLAVLQAMSAGSLQTAHLIGDKIALEAYDAALENRDIAPKATLIKYPAEITLQPTIHYRSPNANRPLQGAVALIGAGAFTAGILLPAMNRSGITVAAIVSQNGASAALLAMRFAIPVASSDVDSILGDEAITTVCIAVQPDAASSLVSRALENGKNVFVEKPLAIDAQALSRVEHAMQNAPGWLHVGFNRRFAPLLADLKKHFPRDAPLLIRMSVNAGPIPPGHWAGNESIGGGRIISEGCHFADLAMAMAGSLITAVSGQVLGVPDTDNFSVNLRFANGCGACINYFSGGAARYSKEHIEVHGGGKSAVLTNWQRLELYSDAKTSTLKKPQDKGHEAQWKELAALIKGGSKALVAAAEVINVSRAVILAKESLRSGGGWITL